MFGRDQVAVVTGASSGIGWALAQELARRGYRVGLVARRRERLEALACELRQQGAVAAVAVADVSCRQQVFAAITQVREQLGPIDLLVANAGVGMETLLDPVNLDEIEEMFRVNTLGVIYAIAAVLPEMLRRARGHLAAISSLAAYKGLPGESAYCASKAAVNTYLEGLRIQLRDRGIAVTTICPGFVQTPMLAKEGFRYLPGLMSAEQAARKIATALERRAKVYHFPWSTTFLTKFSRWLPDWIIAHFLRNYRTPTPEPASSVSR